MLFADVLRVNPAEGENPKSIGLLGAHDVIATLYIITRQMDPITMVTLLLGADRLPRCPRRRHRTAQRLRRCRQAARDLVHGSAGRIKDSVERGTPGATRYTSTKPRQGIARIAVRPRDNKRPCKHDGGLIELP